MSETTPKPKAKAKPRKKQSAAVEVSKPALKEGPPPTVTPSRR